MKILHVLETSLPDPGGYTIRAKAIVDFQRRLGLEPVVVTSPLFPTNDRSARAERQDGVTYYRTNHIPTPASAKSKLASYAIRAFMLRRYRRVVTEIARRERPDVLHAHSSYTNAYAAMPAARHLGVPLVYEVRTLWGEAAVVNEGLSPWKHQLIWKFELGAMKRADAVVPIAKGIRDELARRGVAADKLTIVPNGVDTSRFTPMARDDARMKSARLDGCFVVGFVGTIRKLEGLATLARAFSICRSQGRKMALVIVGDGPDRKPVEDEVRRLGLAPVLFTGTVPHGDVPSWYSVMDVVVYPRTRAVINDRVTPLKPLESMALGKICVGSDVGGLTELIRDDDTGVIFRADQPADLAAALNGLMDDPARMARLRERALEFVRRERDWSAIIPRYRVLYQRAIDVKNGLATLQPAADSERGWVTR